MTPPALAAGHAGVWLAHGDGPPRALGRAAAVALAADTPLLMVNAPLVAARLGVPVLSGLDLLELYAFAHPARFAVPTIAGLATALGLAPPAAGAEEAAFLRVALSALLAAIRAPEWTQRAGAQEAAQALARARWAFGPLVHAALGPVAGPEKPLFQALPRWEERAPRPRAKDALPCPDAVAARLAALLPAAAEDRPGQRAYATAAAHAFAPREAAGAPNVLLAEAGTGIGKTLGYLAPAALWAEGAGGAVWLSTYTRALQRQLAREARRAAPGGHRVVVRKGRENYLCLLNLEDATNGAFSGRAAILAHLVARWARHTADGDMIGGDLPGWLPGLFARAGTAALSDRRGECVRAGCPHFRCCFIEHAQRRAAHADLVVANHALVMVNAVRARAEGRELTRIVFDEGHHLFDAADSAFALTLSGGEAIELRRWLLGPERSTRGRRRGLAARLGDVLAHDDGAGTAMIALTTAAQALPADQWLGRLAEGFPEGPIERLLAAVRAQVLARAEPGDAGHGLETGADHSDPPVVEAAAVAAAALARLAQPLAALSLRLRALIEAPPDWLEGDARARIEAAAAGLHARAEQVAAWGALLARLGGPADPDFIDWLALERADAREYDVALHRRWLDPTRPFAAAVLAPAHGVIVTSATLRARGSAATDPDDWRDTEHRTGATHLPMPPRRFAAPSPFDYAAQARVLVVTDIARGDIAAIAGAYRALIEASRGGALGLFTAISRLRAVHARISDPLARAGLPLLAQHVDPIDTGTLVDMFRADPAASLLGTDALRDGVDVPGEGLRLLLLEGVPWPRRTVLHAARRAAFGGAAYDDLIIQGRIAQAFGRLIRTATDRGVFVLLGAATPTRLLAGLPPGLTIERVPLAHAVAATRAFLSAPLAAPAPAGLPTSNARAGVP